MTSHFEEGGIGQSPLQYLQTTDKPIILSSILICANFAGCHSMGGCTHSVEIGFESGVNYVMF